MGPSTPEERRNAIFKAIEKNAEIGYNELQRETGIPKKTLDNYLDELIEEKIISKTKKGKSKNGKVKFTVSFSEQHKASMYRYLGQLLNHHWTTYKTKIQKTNVFPHYLQLIASIYYEILGIYFFDAGPLYKFALNQLEERLKKDKEQFLEEFGQKNMRRAYEACQYNLSESLVNDALHAMENAGERTIHRTGDEISMDYTDVAHLQLLETEDEVKWFYEGAEKDDDFTIIEDFRVHLIKDKEKREEFLKLTKEYNETAQKLTNLRLWMTNISGMYPIEQRFSRKNK